MSAVAEQEQEQPPQPPTDVVELLLHDNFWWFFQSQHHQDVVATLTAPGAMRTLLDAAFRPSDEGLGLGAEGGLDGNTAVFADGPVKYVNMNPGHGATSYLVTLGKGSEPHRLAFSACQVLLTPPMLAALLVDDAMLMELFRFVEVPPPLPTARAGYFTNLVYQLLDTNTPRMASMVARGGTLRSLLGHAENDSIRRLLCHRIDEVVPIGGKPSDGGGAGGTRWLGLLGGGPLLPLLRSQGVDLSALLLEQLASCVAGESSEPGDAEALTAAAVDACGSWASTASQLTPITANAVGTEGSTALELLTAFNSEAAAESLLAPLGDGARGTFPTAAAHAVLPLLTALVGAAGVCAEGSGVRWGETPLRRRLRAALPALAGWLGPDDTQAADSWCSGAPRVGRLRYAVAGLLTALCASGAGGGSRGGGEDWEDGPGLVSSGALKAMVDALFGFPTAGALHATIMKGLRQIIRRRDTTTTALFQDAAEGGFGSAGLLAVLARVCDERPSLQNLRPPPQYFGHLEQLVGLVVEVDGHGRGTVLAGADPRGP